MRIHRTSIPLAIAALLLVASCGTDRPASPTPTTATATATAPATTIPPTPEGCPGPDGCAAATMRRAVDGDTITADLDGPASSTVTVRLIGVDTPETHHPRKPVGCYGPEAAQTTAKLLPPGARLWLEWDRQRRDRYGRDLAYVWYYPTPAAIGAPWRMVNADLLVVGAARTLVIRPNTRHAAEFAKLQELAQAEAHGLWGACPGGR